MEASARSHRDVTEFARWTASWLMLSSLAWLLLFWSLVVRARLQVGEWPHGRSGNPFDGSLVYSSIDPKAFDLHYDIAWAAMPFAAGSIVFGGLLLALAIWWRRMRPPTPMTLAFALSCALAIATVGLDLGGFFDWFLD
jgi:hypothetical protein